MKWTKVTANTQPKKGKCFDVWENNRYRQTCVFRDDEGYYTLNEYANRVAYRDPFTHFIYVEYPE